MVAYLDQTGVQHLIAKIRDVLWPVGTILATSTNTSPASYIGGSWESYAPGRTLVGVGTFSGDASVEKDHRDVTLGDESGAVVNKHYHWTTVGGGSNTNPIVYIGYLDSQSPVYRRTSTANRVIQLTRSNDAGNAKYVQNSTTTETINIENPYVGVCYWRRTA